MEIPSIDTCKCIVEVLRRTVRRAKEIAGIRIEKENKTAHTAVDMISSIEQ